MKRILGLLLALTFMWATPGYTHQKMVKQEKLVENFNCYVAASREINFAAYQLREAFVKVPGKKTFTLNGNNGQQKLTKAMKLLDQASLSLKPATLYLPYRKFGLKALAWVKFELLQRDFSGKNRIQYLENTAKDLGRIALLLGARMK